MVSPFSSDRRRARRKGSRAGLRSVALALTVTVLGALSGCVTVRPEDKEFLAEQPMTFGAGGEAVAHEEHVFTNREASFGAGGATGGGCGCN